MFNITGIEYLIGAIIFALLGMFLLLLQINFSAKQVLKPGGKDNNRRIYISIIFWILCFVNLLIFAFHTLW